MSVRVAICCGSLRAGSFNRMLMNAVMERCPEGLELLPIEIRAFPPYDDDLVAGGSMPAEVVAAKEMLRSCDALLLVTPEYNFGVPGVLKNAVDWMSRPLAESAVAYKPLALMGASTGYMGTMRSQLAWRQLWHFFHAPVFSDRELTVAFAKDAFDTDGKLTSEVYAKTIEEYLPALRDWLTRLKCEA